MVSQRCKMIVEAELNNLQLHYTTVDLGIIEMTENVSEVQREQLKVVLLRYGLEIFNDKKNILIEKIKKTIIAMVHYADELPTINYSDYISKEIGYDYTYLSNVFSEVRGMTIQQFIIIHRIERAKELLFYNEMNLTEIAFKLNYSSVAHLSTQFKKVTGFTPSFYKKMKTQKRAMLENV